MTNQLTAIAEVPASQAAPIQASHQIHSLTDGVSVVAALALPIVAYGLKELLQLSIKKRNAALELEIKKQAADQQEKAERVEYLEAMVETLMKEIFTLNRAMDRSGPLNVKMYEPAAKESAQAAS